MGRPGFRGEFDGRVYQMPRARIRVLPEEWPSSDGDKTRGFDLFLDNLNVYPPRRLFLLLQM